jgi:lysophospholipase L1-like esterase
VIFAGAPANATQALAPVDMLVLGDSYSIGEGVAEGERWPAQLAAAMRARGLMVSIPQYIATTGWTTDELSAAIDAQEIAGRLNKRFGLVTLQVGVNDQYRGRPVAEFRPAFARLLERAVAFAGGEPANVLVLSIPDWGRTPFARAQGRDADLVTRELDAYNAAAAQVCAARGVRFVDITGLTRTPEGAGAVVDDGLHPSPAMYARWVEKIGSEPLFNFAPGEVK